MKLVAIYLNTLLVTVVGAAHVKFEHHETVISDL